MRNKVPKSPLKRKNQSFNQFYQGRTERGLFFCFIYGELFL